MWSPAPLLGTAERIRVQEGRRFSHIYTMEACKHLLQDVRKRAETSPPALILTLSFSFSSFSRSDLRDGPIMDPVLLHLNVSVINTVFFY